MITLLWVGEEMPTSLLGVEGNLPHTQPLSHIPLTYSTFLGCPFLLPQH